MTQNNDDDFVVSNNSDSQYLKNYKYSIKNWIKIFIEHQREHVHNTPVLQIAHSAPCSVEALPQSDTAFR